MTRREIRNRFAREIRDTLYIHSPLPLHREESLEAGFADKKVTRTRRLYPEVLKPFPSKNTAMTERDGVISFSAPLRSDRWPDGASPDGDYSNFGTASVSFTPDRSDWRPYNRLRFEARPRSSGVYVCHLNVSVENVGETAVPDPYYREGATVFDLEKDRWQDCIWEFSAMPRDAISNLIFYVFLSGCGSGSSGMMECDIRNIRLEYAETAEHEYGWENPVPGVRLSSVGYFPDDEKTAVLTDCLSIFYVIREEDGEIVFCGPCSKVTNERGTFRVADFSKVREPGAYYIKAGDVDSCVFEISADLCRATVWKLINFFYCLRCGTPIPGKHGMCHQDIIAVHGGVSIPFCGGWHDAGDVSQQSAQTAEITHALLECAVKTKSGDLLRKRLIEEARWGLDFILKTRFGDGFRATSAGATRYTDNMIGNFDDIPARVFDHSYENFLFAGVEAYAYLALRDEDPTLAAAALDAAVQDYRFAVRKFDETGVDPAHMYEHTWNSGLSQYHAVRVWSAGLLYRSVGDGFYRDEITEYAGRLMECQETGEAGLEYTGFFYRDETHRTIVHYNHQSREHQFMQAMESACLALPDSPHRPDWEECMRRYGGYLKAVAGSTAPYGMLPDGIHKLDEAEDRDLFPYMHILCDYEKEKENFRQQLASGTPIAPGYVLRRFPVWFSFRGNSAVMLSSGKAASILGRYFGDDELKQIAHEQMYWMWGKNPFGQSLVYGDGSDFCRQYAVHCGECVGQMPVGIETKGNGDVPYWPQNNNATYREVWGASACRMLWLCADSLS